MSDEEQKKEIPIGHVEAVKDTETEDEQGLVAWRVEKIVPHSQLAGVLNKLDETGYAPRFILPIQGGLLVVAGLALDDYEDDGEIGGMDFDDETEDDEDRD